MRILIQTFGSAGDVFPFIGVGRELLARGHEVVLLAGTRFRVAAESAGLAFAAIDTEEKFAGAIADPDLWHPRRGFEKVISMVAETLPATVAAMEERVLPGETVMIGSTLGFAARLLRERGRAPLVTMHLSPSVFLSAHDPPRYAGFHVPKWLPLLLRRAAMGFVDRMSDRVVAKAMAGVREEVDMARPRKVFSRWLHSPDRVIGLWPEWFGPPQPDWPPQVRLTGFPLLDESVAEPIDPGLAAWLAAGDPPVAFTLGSANVHGRRFFAESVAAARALGLRALLVTRGEGVVPAPLPDGVLHVPFAPFGPLLPKLAALVSHGGIGTCARALNAGIPHLVVPMGFDQYDNGTRLEDLGTGAMLPEPRYRADRAARALERLLRSDEVVERCWRTGQRIEELHGIRAACDLVEETVRGEAVGAGQRG